MIPSLSTKRVILTPPAAKVNNGNVTVASLDTLGFDFVDIEVILGDTDVALTTLKLTQSNDDGSTDAYADLAGSLYGGAGSPTLPSATDDNKSFAFHIRLGSSLKKRYLKPAITVGNGATGAFVCVIATLSRAKEMPSSATGRGLGGEINL